MVEKIFNISLFAISVLGFNIAKGFKNSFMIDSGLGADFFPRVICVILGILSLMMLAGSSKEEGYKFTKENRVTFYMILICILYFLILDKIGYLISTILFSFTMIKILNKNSLISNLAFSLIFPSAIYLLFSRVFSVSLPVWGF